MRQSVVLIGAFTLSLFLGSAGIGAPEEAVPVDKIPKAVMDALMSKFPKCKIDKCAKAKEGDAIVYDIEVTQQGGRKGEADIKENGTIINYEKEIDAKDLPKAVRDAVEKKYPKATWKVVMEEKEPMGKEEKLSAYEVNLVPAGKKDEVEVRVTPEGKIAEDTGEKKPEEKK